MAKIVKNLGIRRLFSIMLPFILTFATAILLVVSYVFGAFGDILSMDVIEVVESAISIFDGFNWSTFLFFCFAFVYFFVLVKTVRVIISLFLCGGKLIKAFSKNDISKVFESVAKMRDYFDTIAMLFLIYLVQGLGIFGQGLSTLGFISVIALITTFAINKLSITYSQASLPNIVYLLAELVRFIVIPVIIAQMFVHIRIVETPQFMGSYQFIGNAFDMFFQLPFELMDGKTIVKLIYAVFVESSFLVLTVVQLFLLINTVSNNLYNTNEPKNIHGASPMKKFFGIAKIVGTWIICRCVMFTFFEQGELNFDFAEFFERWVELVETDLFPLLCYALIGGILLTVKFKKNASHYKKKKKSPKNENSKQQAH